MTVIAIDVGGTGIKSALVDRVSFKVRHTERHPTRAEHGPDAVLENLLRVASGLVTRARADGLTPRAVGIVVPGIVDDDQGIAVSAANLGWRDLPLAAVVAGHLGLPTRIGHDVRAGGLAETRLGAGRDVTNLLFVPIGTGIAGAHLIAGHPLTGAHRAACELGHVVVRPGGRRCRCGRRGCLEAEASARAVAERYADLTGRTVTAAEVTSRALAGETAAAEVWRHTVDALADGLLTAITLFDPERIVVGGGLAQAGDQLLGPLRRAIDARRSFEASPTLVPAALGDQAGCLGAALLAAALIPGATR
ncbi:MAG TPA: ROK family protein [Micromonosporaceae bacterium]